MIEIRLTLFVSLLTILLFTNVWPAMAQDPTLSVTGRGTNTYPGQTISYRLELLNHTDQIQYDGILTATLPVSFTYVPSSTLILGEGWPMVSREPIVDGQTLTWGPYHLPAAGVEVRNPFGIHTMMDSCDGIPALHLEGAKALVGNGGFITQLFYPIDTATTGPSQCAINFLQEAYARNLTPILRLQGHRANGIWQAPDPGPNGDYAEIAQAFANYVAGLPRRDTNLLYIAVWNEPDLWIEWSGQPNANQYGRFFVAVSNAIRQLGDARIRVVNGALTPGNMTFLDQMLRVPGFRDAFDVWASHCYPYNHPASYNIHSGSAQYGTYAIDCYLDELQVISNFGRDGVQVMLTETGYALGTDTFGFEGFDPINETNRASYITSAFRDYWQHWPELVAVTPFELTDPSGHWTTFDWVYPHWPYPPHAQYDAVATLPKPAGTLQPYGFQVIFQAGVNSNTLTGTYTLQLAGRDRDNHMASASQAVPVTIFDLGSLQFAYLPIIFNSLGRSQTQASDSIVDDKFAGAIVPSRILTTPHQSQARLTGFELESNVLLSGEPQSMVIDETAKQALILLADHRLEIVDLIDEESVSTIRFNHQLQSATFGPPGSGQVYVSLADGLALIEVDTGRIVKQLSGLGRLRGLSWDQQRQRLWVVASDRKQLLVFEADLSQTIATVPLSNRPDQLILDPVQRRLYISFPGIGRIVAIGADTLTLLAESDIVGQPIVDLALDSSEQRLYVLGHLSPNQQGISILETPSLQRLALLAGNLDVPLQQGISIASASNGTIELVEPNHFWSIQTETAIATRRQMYRTFVPADGLANDQNQLYLLDQQAKMLRIRQ